MTVPRAAVASAVRPRPLERWWVRAALVWLASRIVTTALLLFFAAHEGPTFWAAAHPGYFRFAQFWDSGWYHAIAVGGYPARLPVDAAGALLPNAWAFLPVYPFTVDAVGAVTGIPWDVASVLVAAACSLGAVLLLDRLLQAVGRPASFPVALLCFGPLSAVLQVAYAESTGMLLLAAALLLLVRGRYLPLAPVVLAADLTRPLGPPLAVVVVLHVAARLRRARRAPLRPGRTAAALIAAAAAALGAVLWPLIAWRATGDAGAYVSSELVWRRARVADGPLVPFAAWVDAARRLAGAGGVLVLAAVAAGFVVLLVAVPAVVRLGPDLRLWSGAYAGYLLAVFDPQSSTFRLLLPLFPLLGALSGVRSRTARVVLLLAGVAGQALWIAATWARWHISGWAPP